MPKLFLSEIVGSNTCLLLLKPKHVCYFDMLMSSKDCYYVYFLETPTCLTSQKRVCLPWKAFLAGNGTALGLSARILAQAFPCLKRFVLVNGGWVQGGLPPV